MTITAIGGPTTALDAWLYVSRGIVPGNVMALEDEMQNPMWINLKTPDEVRADGWQAECRDADGHLTRTHVPFDSDEDIVWLVREALEHGDTITIWPVKP